MKKLGQGKLLQPMGTMAPTGAPLVGQVAIAVTGTAVQLADDDTLLPSSTIVVAALSGNSATGACGGSDVTNTVDGTGNGAILEAGEKVVIIAETIGAVYVNGTAGDIFTYSAG